MTSAVTVTQADASSWASFLRDFPGAYKAFNDNRGALLKLQPYIYGKHPELRAQYDSLVERSNTLAPKLATIKGVYDQVKGFLGSAANVYQGAVDATSVAIEKIADGISAARRFLGLGNFGELGVAPLVLAIGAAAALATLGAVVKWITDAFSMAKRVNALQDLEAKGYAPADAAAALNKLLGNPDKPGILSGAVSQLLWIGGALVLAWLVVPLIAHRRASRASLSTRSK